MDNQPQPASAAPPPMPQPQAWGAPLPGRKKPRKGTGRFAVALYCLTLGFVLGAVATSGSPSPTSAPAADVTPAGSYKNLTSREWKLLAKDPASHKGKGYVVYGVVSQFDSATGVSAFRANVDGIRHGETYEYETNTLMSGDESALDNLVEDDMFTARVTVVGSSSYDTQIGGHTNAPQLSVDSITVLNGKVP